MSKIIQFPGGGKEREPIRSDSLGSNPPGIQNDNIRQFQRPERDGAMEMFGITIPSKEALFDDEKITFGTTPITECRRKLDESGSWELGTMLECTLAIVKVVYIRGKLPPHIQQGPAIKLGKTVFEIGLEMGDRKVQNQGRGLLVDLLGADKTSRVMKYIRLKRQIDQGKSPLL